MSSFNEYDDYCDHIEQIMKNQNSGSAFVFKHNILDEMERRTKEVMRRGLKDKAVAHALIIDEFNEKYVLDNYREFLAVSKEKRILRRIPIIYALIMLASVIAFVTIGFTMSIWHPTWLIIVAAALLIAVNSMLYGASMLHRRKFLYFVIRILVAGTVMVLTVMAFLIIRIPFGIERAYLIFLVMLAFMFIGDLILATVTRQRLFIINYLVSIPVIAVFLYVILSLVGIIAWHPGWLIIIFSLIVDVLVLFGFIKHNRKYAYTPEVQEEW